MISPYQREKVLDQSVQGLIGDVRVAGVLLIGSGVDGFIDELSDIDLLVVVNDVADVTPVHDDWTRTVHQRFPVLHHARTPFTESHHLQIFILDELLEVDTSFIALESLEPRWDRGRILFDRTGVVADHLKHARRPESRLEDYLWLFDQACHRVMEGRKALHRGKLWQAALVLDELRTVTAQLAGLVVVGSIRQRDVDRLPQAFLAMLAETVVPVESQTLHQALQLLTTMMLGQAEQLYERVDTEFPHRFASALLTAVTE